MDVTVKWIRGCLSKGKRDQKALEVLTLTSLMPLFEIAALNKTWCLYWVNGPSLHDY